ncbi:MAG TPA: sulfite exporter TauE/SafE family protein [Usitatibacter sp.]|nr:sulfite exporter TauE/SafE family protein [Usitatibacter sp.]
MTEAAVAIGGLLGGLASGLTGFGFGLTSLPLWAHVLAPAVASPLVIACSIAGQLQTLPKIWHAIDLRRLAPFVILGLAGVPIGVWLLPLIAPGAFRIALGALVVVACATLLWLRIATRRESSRAGDAIVGFTGGVLGGITGLSGVPATIWAELHGWGKDERRAIFQGFNISILVLALAGHAVAGSFTPSVLRLLLVAIPATLVGAWAGRKLYDRVDARRFGRIVLWLVLCAGASLLASGLVRAWA